MSRKVDALSHFQTPMTKYTFQSDPDDWSNDFSQAFLATWAHRHACMVDLFKDLESAKKNSFGVVTSNNILKEFTIPMSRPKGKSQNANGTDGSDNRKPTYGNKLEWANFKLTDEDKAALTADQHSLEYIAAYITSLANDGWSVTTKRLPDGKSFSCSIIRPHPIRSGISVGISSFGSTVRNAQLSLMYKFGVLLGEDVDNIDAFIGDVAQRSDFG